MMKRLFCILLSVILLAAAPFALAEDAPAEEAAVAEEPAAEEAAPVLLVTVNGEEIWSNDSYLNLLISYYIETAQNSGYDTTDQSMLDLINQYALDYTIRTRLIKQKSAELGLGQITDEEKAGYEEAARIEWAEIVDNYAISLGLMTADSSDEDKAAARADTLTTIKQQGYDEDRYVAEYVEGIIEGQETEGLKDHLTEGKTVTDEEVQAYYDDLVKDDRETYENDIGTYEFYTQYYGQSSYYTPEGYRGIIHILLPVEEELLNEWKDLSARLEEQESKADEEPTESTEAPAEDAEPTAEPEPAAEPEPTAEPVTKEMVDAAEQKILDSVQGTVDEIMGKLEGGTSFEDLIKEYGTDSGMQDESRLASGYAVHNDSIMFDPAFQKAAMALEKIGDVSKPVVGQYGVHILQYLRDIPGGAAELTDEMKEEFRATLLDEHRSDALNSALDEWIAKSDIVYTEEGEKWKIPEEETAEEAAPEEEAAPAGE